MDIGERMLPILPEVNKPKALKNMKKSILQQTQTTKEQKTVTFAGTKMFSFFLFLLNSKIKVSSQTFKKENHAKKEKRPK